MNQFVMLTQEKESVVVNLNNMAFAKPDDNGTIIAFTTQNRTNLSNQSSSSYFQILSVDESFEDFCKLAGVNPISLV